MVIVVVAVIRNAKGQVLWTQRHEGVHCAGLWELPGGKCERGETCEVALQRECEEELGIQVRACRPIQSFSHTYPDRQLALHVYEVLAYEGIPQPLAAQAMRWCDADDARRLRIPEANEALMDVVY